MAYKQKRNIINYSYQTRADNIVGKMTIAALDEEMLDWERRRTRTPYCGDPIEGGAGSASYPSIAPRFTGFSVPSYKLMAFNSDFPTTAPMVVPKNLDILWQPARGAGQSGRPLKYLTKAVHLLDPFGLKIMSSVTSPPDQPFPYDPVVDPDVDDNCWELRKMAEKARPGAPKVLRILVCPFPADSRAFGATKSGTFKGVSFPPFVLINSAAFRTDECTLLHEMIHASDLNLKDKDHDPDKTSVFATGNNRSVLKIEHAAKISHSFFARFK